MDIMNLQNFLVKQAPLPAFITKGTGAEKSSVPVRQSQQKADNFASKLNSAVERSAKNHANETLDAGKPVIIYSENQSGPAQVAENSKATGNEQPLGNGTPATPDELPAAASPSVPIPPAANITGENITVQINTLQGVLSENPGFFLTADGLKNLSADAEILKTIFSNADAAGKGQMMSQTELNELLAAAKRELEILAKEALAKNSGAEGETSQQSNNTAKQPQSQFQNANLLAELAKQGTDALNAADVAKPAAMVEIAKLTVIDATKPVLENLKTDGQPVVPETNGLTLKEPAEQNLADRQNTSGQQSFDQTMEFKAGQIKNPDQQLNNSQPFAISFDTAASNAADKPGAAQTQQPAAEFQLPRDEFQIKAQIVEQATLINRSAQESEMIIRLKPEHLGELALKVTVANGVVNASFHSNNAEVRNILENSVQQLKNDLANAGFKVDNVSISAGLSQFNADQERALQWQQQQTMRVSGKNGEDGYAEAVEGVQANQQVINASKDAGVDYRI